MTAAWTWLTTHHRDGAFPSPLAIALAVAFGWFFFLPLLRALLVFNAIMGGALQ